MTFIEKKVSECDEGTYFGEIAMIDPERGTRSLSAKAKTDCIFLIVK